MVVSITRILLEFFIIAIFSSFAVRNSFGFEFKLVKNDDAAQFLFNSKTQLFRLTESLEDFKAKNLLKNFANHDSNATISFKRLFDGDEGALYEMQVWFFMNQFPLKT